MDILIIEDDAKTWAYLKKAFAECGVSAEVAQDGEEGLQRALDGLFDVVVLDVMLPKLDGWQVLRELRRRRHEIPVIMLTGRDALPDRIKGFETGADDYLIKPFAFSELLVRISAILRRSPALKQDILRVADMEIDQSRGQVSRLGTPLDLTPKEFAILNLLAKNAGTSFTKSAILERVWGLHYGDFNLIEVHITRLRAKVDGPFSQKLIHTVRGRGYILENRT